jgi:hypothetical protein
VVNQEIQKEVFRFAPELEKLPTTPAPKATPKATPSPATKK